MYTSSQRLSHQTEKVLHIVLRACRVINSIDTGGDSCVRTDAGTGLPFPYCGLLGGPRSNKQLKTITGSQASTIPGTLGHVFNHEFTPPQADLVEVPGANLFTEINIDKLMLFVGVPCWLSWMDHPNTQWTDMQCVVDGYTVRPHELPRSQQRPHLSSFSRLFIHRAYTIICA